MSGFINGVPFNWDNQQDHELFKFLFNDTLPPYVYEPSVDFPQFPADNTAASVFAGKSAEELAAKEQLHVISISDGFTVYTDQSERIALETQLEEVVVTYYKPTKELDMGSFTLKLFIHEDGLKIRQYYREVTPNDNDIIFFLEKNDDYNRMGTVMYVNAGIGIMQKDIPFAEVFASMSGEGVNIRKKDLERLLEPQSLQNKKSFLSRAIKAIATVPNNIVSFLTKYLANFSGDLLAPNIRKLMIDEKYWNPQSDFYTERYFRSGTQLLEQQNLNNKAPSGKGIHYILRGGFKVIEQAESRFQQLIDSITKPLPLRLRTAIRSSLKKMLNIVTQATTYLKEQASQLVTFLVDKGYKFANGLLCGIINGIIEGLAGTLEFIAVIFRLVSVLNKMVADDLWDSFIFLKEMLENVIEAFLRFDLGRYLMVLIKAPFTIAQALITVDINQLRIKVGEALVKLNAAKVGYYAGYSFGLIFEMILETLATGGVAAAAKVMRFTKELAEGAFSVTVRAGSTLKAVTKDSAEAMIKRITAFFQSLRDGTALPALQKWLDDLILEIKKALGLVDEVAESSTAARTAATNLMEKYPRNILSGDDMFRTLLTSRIEALNLSQKIRNFERNAEKLFNSKQRKVPLEVYKTKVIKLIKNKEIGKLTEEIFITNNKGVKAKKAEFTTLTKRYVDNILSGIAKELKSGKVKLGNNGNPAKGKQCFETQFAKDCEIMLKDPSPYQIYEWHCLGGIDDNALKWALEHAEKANVIDKIKFVIY